MGIPVTVVAPASATTGENYGFIVLTLNGVSRRVPYSFLVERPALANVPAKELVKLQTGDTAVGPNRVSQYCCPSEPFGPPPDYSGTPMNEDGSETLYYTWREQLLEAAKERYAGPQRAASETAELRKKVSQLERALGRKTYELEIAGELSRGFK